MTKRGFISLIALLLLPLMSFGAPTASQQMQTCVKKYLTKNLTVSFAYSGAMGSGNGTLRGSGEKFSLETPSGSVWYDGRTMWTYSQKTKETTVVNPSKSEIAEANPIGLLRSASSFNARYAPKQTSGNTTIILTPKASGSGVKRVVAILDAKTLMPKKIDVTLNDGGRTVVSIKSLIRNASHAAAAFRYPQSRYPKAKIVDLR